MWLLSWAVLFLIVIYSPIGSPELYRQNTYVVYNQGVSFNHGITNAPTTHSYQSNDASDMEVPVYTTATKTYAVNTPIAASSTTGKTNYSISATVNNHIETTQSSGSASSGSSFMFMNSHGAAQGKPTIQTNGITTLNTDLASANQTTTRQLVTDGTLDGGTDPGGDPNGPPIPVGDGFWILIMLASVYVVEKTFLRNKTNES